jgi:hypothetical protein
LSYADGYLGQWEDYFDMMEPAISKVPFLIGDGNHESGVCAAKIQQLERGHSGQAKAFR